ncbi:hypothetical protein G4X40_09000 [Rhodococcus sp. D2-41]|uniref:Secreted protein n=1 Tax=Speluncibacter jeojiensis TaxID=2710754 RepID=A0A9X4RF14_9ACTN|nr:hypothetical protein [Rhodococcus sp. D2-41]MDG3010289.1 hypothetical protein [Rhodococcus sp. D2-41]MDG3015802.1 hypothetical protein [Corynebacteriales bacterium D3-21]
MRTLTRKPLKVAAGVAASAAVVGTMALAAPATASAATTTQAPVITTQLSGNNVSFTLQDNNSGVLEGCAAAVVDAKDAVKISGALANITDPTNFITVLNSGVIKGTPAATTILNRTATGSAGNLPNGVYVVVGACGGVGEKTATAMKPVIIPSGAGSVTSVLDLGSTVLQNPDSIPVFLGLLSGGGLLGNGS